MSLGTIDAWEVVWEGLFLVALVSASYNLWDAWKLYVLGLEDERVSIRFTAVGDRDAAIILFLIALLGNIAGVVTMTIPGAAQPEGVPVNVALAAVLIRVIFILFAILVVLKCLLGTWLRRTVLALRGRRSQRVGAPVPVPPQDARERPSGAATQGGAP